MPFSSSSFPILSLFLLALLAELLSCHKVLDFETAARFAARQGLMVSFEHPVYSNGYFLGFEVTG